MVTGGIFGFLLLLYTIIAINEDNQPQIASYSEGQISEPVETETPSLQSDRFKNSVIQDRYLSNSSPANLNSFSTSNQNTGRFECLPPYPKYI